MHARRACKDSQTRCLTFLKGQTTVNMERTVSIRRRSYHAPRWHRVRVLGAPSAAWKAVSLTITLRASPCRLSHWQVVSAT